MFIYLVKAGDNIDQIAMEFGVSVWRLIADNQLRYPYPLAVGQALLIRLEVVPTEKDMFANGFAYPFIQENILQETLPYLSELSIFSYGFSSQGQLILPQLPVDSLIEAAWTNGCVPILTLTPFGPDGNFNNLLIHTMLTNETSRSTLIEEIYEELQRKNYGGVNVDFEYILAEDRDFFTEFVEILTLAVMELGGTVTVDLAPKTSDTQQGLLYEGKDYQALGQVANRVFLMTYEWGYTYGPPMAVAPLQKVREVVEYGVSRIAREKITMGIPNYGYDWSLPFVRGETKARTIGNIEAMEIAVATDAVIRYDELAQTPYFHYVEGNTTHEVWFEDARSIAAKYQLQKEYSLYGFGCWQIMRLFRPMWLLTQFDGEQISII